MASKNGHEEVVRLLLQSGAQDLPYKVEKTSQTTNLQNLIFVYLAVSTDLESIRAAEWMLLSVLLLSQ